MKKMGDKKTSEKELRGLAGAPRLDVSDVRAMKITMKPNECSGTGHRVRFGFGVGVGVVIGVA